ncbi:hypothetical protein JJV70_11640 [Streptomyces sp. JJ66]|uniref:hypothetical protein n=1 Tax=Streptomyces sp. JJ66 TaxID=2803843 RepID=UPI001C5805B9|nr:hypothetical protein [Streptomyces sp. JJ66]MBW1602749.1 hypothetical protein [Streptomyces sp. JJ66]
MTDFVHILMDDSALVAAGRGNELASRLIHRAHAEPGWHLYTTACALVEADRTRRGTAEHFAALPAVVVLELDLPSALAVAQEDTWAAAHTEYAAQPSPDRPLGAFVASAAPRAWKGRPVRLIDLSA